MNLTYFAGASLKAFAGPSCASVPVCARQKYASWETIVAQALENSRYEASTEGTMCQQRRGHRSARQCRKAYATIFGLLLIGCSVVWAGQQQSNVNAQREAMKKLSFLTGKWAGDAQVMRGPGQTVKLLQTEDVHFKLDGLLLLIEGTGRGADGKVEFEALATVTYDDATGTYHFRAYSGGRYVDADLAVTPRGFSWGYTSGPLKVVNTMRLDENGNWVETTETAFHSSPPTKSVMMKLHRQN